MLDKREVIVCCMGSGGKECRHECIYYNGYRTEYYNFSFLLDEFQSEYGKNAYDYECMYNHKKIVTKYLSTDLEFIMKKIIKEHEEKK
jgi:hypothetical protein